MMTLPEALRTLHRRRRRYSLAIRNWQHPAQRRLILEELLAHNLSMLAYVPVHNVFMLSR